MNEEIMLKTLCGCTKIVRAPLECKDYIVPIKPNATFMGPTATLTYISRVFKYEGSRIGGTRVFEEVREK